MSCRFVLAVAAGVALLSSPAARADDDRSLLSAQVRKALVNAQLIWTRPAGFAVVPAKRNRAMAYDFAIKSSKVKLEVRYAIRHHVEDRGSAMFAGLISTTVLNLTHGDEAPLRRFPPASVASELNATEGVTTTITPAAAGWTGYQRCMIVAIRRDGGAEAYIFFLFDDLAAVNQELERAFHAMRFTPPP